ncbi:MAG TPA: N-formylglutamate amidohydrolase [Caulobacteraceae bacterium]|nr:N-formylglutamate amidohydrolase [Caulobacteraceae bacterium]
MNKRCADSSASSNALLGPGDPSPAIVVNPGGPAPFLLLGDHAGRRVPQRLGDLGLPPEAFERHIAWDIGVAGVGERLAAALDAPFIRQAYSRLVIDCNRVPGAEDSVPEISDGQSIPGNLHLNPADRAARRDEIYAPYQAAISAALDQRDGRPTLLVSLHSFTPVFQGFARPWRFGVLHRNDSGLSRRALAWLRAAFGEAAGDNQPYAMDGIDNTIPLHADARGLDYLELEMRQDLVADAAGQDEVAAVVARLLRAAGSG